MAMKMVTLPQLVIFIVGISDLAAMSATFCGLSVILKLNLPEGAEEVIPLPSLEVWWFGFNLMACFLLWFTATNMATLAILSQFNNFRRGAFAPWFFMGIFALFMSLLGNALVGDAMAAMLVICTRILFIFAVWFCIERWEWELNNPNFRLRIDEEQATMKK